MIITKKPRILEALIWGWTGGVGWLKWVTPLGSVPETILVIALKIKISCYHITCKLEKSMTMQKQLRKSCWIVKNTHCMTPLKVSLSFSFNVLLRAWLHLRLKRSSCFTVHSLWKTRNAPSGLKRSDRFWVFHKYYSIKQNNANVITPLGRRYTELASCFLRPVWVLTTFFIKTRVRQSSAQLFFTRVFFSQM